VKDSRERRKDRLPQKKRKKKKRVAIYNLHAEPQKGKTGGKRKRRRDTRLSLPTKKKASLRIHLYPEKKSPEKAGEAHYQGKEKRAFFTTFCGNGER